MAYGLKAKDIGRELENADIYGLVYRATQQIPEGHVSTYGAIARALGDVSASRAVGRALNLNPRPIIVPCHRVVGSTGDLVGFGLGLKKKKEWLRKEGIRFDGDKVADMDRVLFSDFKLPHILKKMRSAQMKVASVVDTGPMDTKPRYLAAADVHYPSDGVRTDRATGEVVEVAQCAIVVYDTHLKRIAGTFWGKAQVKIPYIPTYLAFRELPPLREALKKAGLGDDCVLIMDGNGILHPFTAGLASHCGVVLGRATIGVAKSHLCGEFDAGNLGVGRPVKVLVDGEPRGYAIKASSRQKNPVFISPGHGMSPEDALRIIKPYLRYKVPEPIRWAHEAAKRGEDVFIS